jgi:hypothetical protein
MRQGSVVAAEHPFSLSRSVDMKLTGHETPAVYWRYAIVSSGDLRDAVRRLEDRYTPGDTPASAKPTSKRIAQKS